MQRKVLVAAGLVAVYDPAQSANESLDLESSRQFAGLVPFGIEDRCPGHDHFLVALIVA
jgi:hypothetical protein